MSSENVSEGIKAFNAGDYFEAHEHWEDAWRVAEEPSRSRLKALIQLCGVAVHVTKGKFDPARRLALRAVEIFAEATAHEKLLNESHRDLEVDVPGAEDTLLWIAAEISVAGKDPGFDSDKLLDRIRQLRAYGKGDR